jgi:glucokinase
MHDDWLLGIEIGGTKLQLGLGRQGVGLEIVDRRRIEPARGASAILDQLREGYAVLLERASTPPSRILGAGIGFGGPVDVERGRTQRSYQVSGWDDYPLGVWVKEHLGIGRVEIQNDADTAGLAEARLGAGIGCSPLLYLTIGSGIGGALIVDGRIYRGAGLGAVEIGHLQVPDLSEAPPRLCELEQVASGWAIGNRAQDVAKQRVDRGERDWQILEESGGEPAGITAETVARGAGRGDRLALAILDRAHRALAYALRQAIALVAPRRIILGGGVSLIGEALWFEPIRRLVDAEVFAPFRGSFDIVPATLGEQVVVHGALLLAADAAKVAS